MRVFDGDVGGAWLSLWRDCAHDAADRGLWLQAALCYGAARYPVLGTNDTTILMNQQREAFLRVPPHSKVMFERRLIRVLTGNGGVEIPVHVYSAEPPDRSPALVLMSGGLDTYKIELHQFALALARVTRLTLAVMDMPGTGETEANLEPHSEQTYRAVLQALPGPNRRGVLGVSFGGHWAAKMAVLGLADFAINLGGPVDAKGIAAATLSGQPEDMRFMIERLVGSGRAFTNSSTELVQSLSLSTQGLLSPISTPPLLVVNGADDPYINPADTLVFQQFPNARVELIPHCGHCGPERSSLVGALIASWLLLLTAPKPSLRRAAGAVAWWWSNRLTVPPIRQDGVEGILK